jgi:DedD protein
MDKVLKQRLIGASILIALAVIFLPMLFDGGEEERAPRQLALDLPERPEGQREVRRLPLDPDRARTPPRDTEAEPPADMASDLQREPEPAPVGEPQPLPDPVAEPEPTPDVEPVPEPAPEPLPDPVPEAEPEPEPVPEPEPAPEVTPAASDGDWIVQVAVFSNRGTAERIGDQLDGLGHSVAIEAMTRDESELWRLRTGPYASRGDADTARGQIAATVTGVEPVVRSRGTTQPASTTDRSGYAVQVGSFASRNNADRLIAQLVDQGHDAYVYSEESGGRTIHRVRVGIFAEREDAQTLQARLRDEAGLEGIVVSHP